jgi:hypothetical protein
MLHTIQQMNGALQGAEAAHDKPKAAIGNVDRALELANGIRYTRNVALADAIARLLLAAHRQLNRMDAAIAPRNTAGTNRGVENRKAIAAHGSLQI